MEHDIWSFSYGYIQLKGFYTEYKGTPQEINAEENSFFIMNNIKSISSAEFKYNMLQLASKYNQECIILGTKDPKEIVLITPNGEKLVSFSKITTKDLDLLYSRIRHRNFKFIESNCKNEERTRITQTFGTVMSRIMLREELTKNFPHLEKFRDKNKF